MDAIIITIGDEILLGQILDSNSQSIACGLTHLGVEVVDIISIPDKGEKIKYWVDYAMSNAQLVIITGGLGPTRDDVTKKVLAEYFDSPLVLNQEVLDRIEKQVNTSGKELNEGNRDQAMLPEKAKILHNRKGTASGMWFEKDGKVLISLPGVPFEMEHLMHQYVIPELQNLYPKLMLDYRMLKVYDISESDLACHLKSWEEGLPQGFSLSYLPSTGLVKLRLTAKGEDIQRLELRYDSLKEELAGIPFTEGENVGIEYQLAELLMIKDKTVSTAESCTGGNIAHLITSLSGASSHYYGTIVAYSNEVKIKLLKVKKRDLEKYGAVSEEIVRQMADNVRKIMKTDYAVSTSGIAGPDGGTPDKPVGTVWIAVSSDERTVAKKFQFSFNRERNIGRATVKAIEMLIQELRNNNSN